MKKDLRYWPIPREIRQPEGACGADYRTRTDDPLLKLERRPPMLNPNPQRSWGHGEYQLALL